MPEDPDYANLSDEEQVALLKQTDPALLEPDPDIEQPTQDKNLQ